MEAIHLPAHFDGDNIVLDEPFDLEPNMRLLVTVVSGSSVSERQVWLNLSRRGLDDSYGENEPEYTLDTLKEVNPDYEGR